MPRYDFKCHTCEKITKDVILPITHREGDTPVCCDEDMRYHITSPPQVMWKDPNIDAFRHVGIKGSPVVSSMKEHRECLARNDIVDANDLFDPPSVAEQKRSQAEAQESIDSITPTVEQKRQLQVDGLDSILE